MSVVTSPERISEYMTGAEVAEELRCSEPTIRRRVRSGELPAVRLGTGRAAIRIPRADLVRWLRQSQDVHA
jgi:excisionase family DNA binding protein